jgi:hypothetical protein
MDGPNAGVPEGCTINNPGLLSYISDRFGNPTGAIHVSAAGSYTDNFYIACPDTQIAASPSTSFTLGYWVQISQFPNDGANCTLGCGYRMFTILATNSDNGGCRKYLAMDIGSGGGGLADACQGGVNGNIGELFSSTSVMDGAWHNLIWVFDHTNNLITFYLDGIQNGAAPLPDPPYTPQNTQFLAGAENGSFALNGNMDDVWIEDHAWTPGDVARYYYGLSNTIDMSPSGGKPTQVFMAQLQQAGVENVVVKAPQPCATTDCQQAIKIAGEQFTAFLNAGLGFHVAAYCYLHFQTTSPTGDVQANNCIGAIPQSDFPAIHFIALDVEELPVSSQSDAVTIISAAANTIAPMKKVVIYTNASFWNQITGNINTPQFSSYSLWNTTAGEGGFRDKGPPLSPGIPSTLYCGTGVPSLTAFTPFAGWTKAKYAGSQYYVGPYLPPPTKCKTGGSLFGVSLDFDVFEPSLFQ